MSALYTGDVLTPLTIVDGDYWPKLLVDHPLPDGAGSDDVTFSEYPGTPSNSQVIRLSHVDMAYFQTAAGEDPGCIKRGPVEEPESVDGSGPETP